jgi:DNA-binding NtrC family response regulator
MDTTPISALVVGAREDDSEVLERALREHSVRALRAGTCKEARRILAAPQPPQLLFTDTSLPDGTWADMVKEAGEASAPVDVIVVSRLDDVNLYLETIEKGAFDFISSPLPGPDFAHVVECASADVDTRRKAATRIRIARSCA